MQHILGPRRTWDLDGRPLHSKSYSWELLNSKDTDTSTLRKGVSPRRVGSCVHKQEGAVRWKGRAVDKGSNVQGKQTGKHCMQGPM